MPTPKTHRTGFTVTELLITVALIAVLLGFLLPALGGVWSQGDMTRSMSNMRKVGAWMQLYSTDNADYVLPSRFHYDPDAGYAGQVRSPGPDGDPNLPTGVAHSGTWADILHSGYADTVYRTTAQDVPGYDYRHDSPDRPLYDLLGESEVKSPFRSTANNPRGAANGGDPKPFGPGAMDDPGANEVAYPGFFAANDFFAAGWPGAAQSEVFRWVTNGQIKYASRSMYLVDSWAGEVIDHYGREYDPEETEGPIEVDFRYADDVCLMLFLDGHIDPQGRWQSWQDLGQERQIRIDRLESRQARLDYRP